MEVRITEDCTACAICEDISPDIFEMGDEKALVRINPVPEEQYDNCLDAADQCPAEAIEIIR